MLIHPFFRLLVIYAYLNLFPTAQAGRSAINRPPGRHKRGHYPGPGDTHKENTSQFSAATSQWRWLFIRDRNPSFLSTLSHAPGSPREQEVILPVG